jgi:hypothetical protein
MKRETRIKNNVYALPEEYLKRQHLVKMLRLQVPRYELVMWFYHTPKNDKEYLYGIYLDDTRDGNALCAFYFNTETLQREGHISDGYNRKENCFFGLKDIHTFLRAKGCGTTDLLGYVLGVTRRPPTPEKKIIQFPVQSIGNKKATA